MGVDMMYWDTYSIDEIIDDIYLVLVERADGEEDPKAQKYNEYLLNGIELIREYIHKLEAELNKSKGDL